MPRMKILDATEQACFDKPPLLGSEERKRFFDFSAALINTAQRFRTPCHRVGFLLACGYFRAAKKFFSPSEYHPADIAYVAGRLNASPECFSAQGIPETTTRRHRQHILSYFGFRPFDQDAAEYITPEIAHMGVWQRFCTNWARSYFRVRLPSTKANSSTTRPYFIYITIWPELLATASLLGIVI